MLRGIRNNAMLWLLALLPASRLPAQELISIRLQVNDSKQAALYRNETVLIDLWISHASAPAAARWNGSGERRLEELAELLKAQQISPEQYERDTAIIRQNRKEEGKLVLGNETMSWTREVQWLIRKKGEEKEVVLPLRQLAFPQTPSQAVLDAKGLYLACFGMDSLSFGAVKPGVYTIRAMIKGERSGSVELTIKEGLLAVGQTRTSAYLLRTGRYYWHAGETEKCIDLARQLLSMKPGSIEALILKGDGYLQQPDYVRAKEAYEKALQVYYQQAGPGAEPPEYLLSMISWIKSRTE